MKKTNPSRFDLSRSRAFGRVAGVISVASCLAMGAVGTADTGATLVPPTSDTPPPFNTSLIPAALGSTFSSGCAVSSAFSGITGSMGQIGAAMNDPMSAMSANLGSLGANGGVACGSDQVATLNGPPSCQLFYQGNTFSTAYYNSQMAQLNMIQAAVSCKEGAYNQAINQVQCLTTQESQLATMIQQQLGIYQNTIQAMQSNVAQIVSFTNDRQNQQKAVEEQLNGNGSSDPGLLKAQANLNQMTQAMATAIPQTQTQIIGVNLQAQQLQTQVAQRSIALTQDCFMNKTNILAFQCQTTGPPCSAEQYLVAQYTRAMGLDSNGYQDPNNTLLQTGANNQGQALQNVLNSIFSESSSNPNVFNANPNPSTVTAQANQVSVVYTPQQIAQTWGQQLASFNTPYFNVYNFVMSNIDKCYINAQSVVSQEQSGADSTSGLYNLTMQLNKSRIDLNNSMNAMIDTYAQGYSTALGALTGSNYPIPTSACKAASIQNKYSCLTDLRKNSLDLLTGSAPNSQVNLFYQANNLALNLNVPCSGVNGCVTALQNVDRNLTASVNQLQQNQKDYVLAANQEVDRYTAALAASLGLASGALQQRLNTLNQTLMAVGLPSINPPPIQGAALTKDSTTGLYNVPTNLLQIVGGQLAPPLPDLTGAGGSGGGVLSNFSSQLQQAQQNENQTASQVQMEKNQLTQTMTNCKDQLKNNLLTNSSNYANQIISNGCMSNSTSCQDTASAFRNILDGNSLSGLSQLSGSGSGTDPAAMINSVLSTGISQCQQAQQNNSICPNLPAYASGNSGDSNASVTSLYLLPNEPHRGPAAIALAHQRQLSCDKWNIAQYGLGTTGEQSANDPALCSQLSANLQNSLNSIQNNLGGTNSGGVGD